MKITERQLRRVIREIAEEQTASSKNNRIAFDEVESADGKTYRVSTINRASSALAAYGEPYAETLVWDLTNVRNINGREIPALVWQGSAWEGSRRTHDLAVSILRTKSLKALEDEI